MRLAARQQSASGLEQHARRIRPAVDWSDLVLPERPLTQLHELALRARHRDRVLGDWRLSAGGGRGRGVLGLFAGESGTGKTLSAEVVAAELGLDLYVVQLSSVVDKYVGETEKNLERIFTEADRTDAVLLFDEADAVFGKRSEVKDSHDRYANMESAYLLQRLESFDGIALLTTNLRANIDEAFTRRLDLVVDFPFPDAGQRLALWRHSLSHVPCADDLQFQPVAADFELAGGSIRSAVVTAAYLAAGRGDHVTSADLLEGARREYRKAGGWCRARAPGSASPCLDISPAWGYRVRLASLRIWKRGRRPPGPPPPRSRNRTRVLPPGSTVAEAGGRNSTESGDHTVSLMASIQRELSKEPAVLRSGRALLQDWSCQSWSRTLTTLHAWPEPMFQVKVTRYGASFLVLPM